MYFLGVKINDNEMDCGLNNFWNEKRVLIKRR